MAAARRASDRRRPSDDGLKITLAHHDAAIVNLSTRMTGVETGLKTLEGEVHHGFASIGSKIDHFGARPVLDFHKTVSTVLHLAILFSMIVCGIIWVTTSQFSGIVAEQKMINARLGVSDEVPSFTPPMPAKRKR